MPDSTGITVNFRTPDFERVDEAAWDHRMSKNEFIRYCISRYFEDSGNDPIEVEL